MKDDFDAGVNHAESRFVYVMTELKRATRRTASFQTFLYDVLTSQPRSGEDFHKVSLELMRQFELRLGALLLLIVPSTIASPHWLWGIKITSELAITVTRAWMQPAIVVRVDLHGKKIGYRLTFPGCRKPLGDFSLFGGEEASGFPPFGLVALGSLHFHQHLCLTEIVFRCAPMPFCNLCTPCIGK